MGHIKQLLKSLGWHRRAVHRVLPPGVARRLVLSEASIQGLRDCLLPDIEKQHEGIAYLYGHTDGNITVVMGAIRPLSHTTTGSFDVSAIAMAKVVRAVSNLGLQVVGQAHTHPTRAFHSEGDELGARIVYQGFVSMVAPDHGCHLPSLTGSVVYFFNSGKFVELTGEAVSVAPGAIL